MAKMTLGQAAKAGFASRASIYRDAAAGKLSIEVQGDRKLVELSELVRVYGEPGSRPLPAAVVVAAPELAQRVDLERRVAELEAAKAAVEGRGPRRCCCCRHCPGEADRAGRAGAEAGGRRDEAAG